MAESSRYWTTSGTGDGPSGGYGANTMQEMLRGMLSTSDGGVSRGRGGELLVTTGSGQVTVATGDALVYGVYYINDSTLTVAVPTPTTSTRQDRIILRYGSVAQTVRCVRLAGTEGAGLPALTNTTTIWEWQIATLSVTTGGTITVTNDATRFIKSPGALSVSDETTLTYNSGTKTLGVKAGGISGGSIASPLSLTQFVATASGGASSAGVYVNSAQPSIGFNETDQAADEKMWDFAVNSKTFFLRVFNDALNSSANVISIVRGTGIALASFTINVALTVVGSITATSAAISGAISAASVSITGAVASTQSGLGSSSGLSVTSSQPSVGWRETTQAANEKQWDIVIGTKVMQFRSVDDANSTAVNAVNITRGTGTAIAGIGLNANTTVTGALAVSGGITGNLSGNATTANAVAAGSVGTAGLADNSVDDTKAGDRVPQFYRRKGGSSTDWSSAGSTDYTPTSVRMQAGSVSVSVTSGQTSGAVNVVFPVTFSNLPLVIATCAGSGNNHAAFSAFVSASSVNIAVQLIALSGPVTVVVNWLAIGPE